MIVGRVRQATFVIPWQKLQSILQMTFVKRDFSVQKGVRMAKMLTINAKLANIVQPGLRIRLSVLTELIKTKSANHHVILVILANYVSMIILVAPLETAWSIVLQVIIA